MIFASRHFLLFLVFIAVSGGLVCLSSCQHELALDDDGTVLPPVDTTTVEPPDTIAGIVCSPDTIHFEWEVLPILKSSCGRRDCHDAGAASSGVKLVNYQTVMLTGGIKPFMPEETRIYKQITHDDEEERMPPPPYDRLSERQVQIIAAWINQGAQNFRCDSSTIPCDADSVSFSADIVPLVKDACYGCHNQYVHESGIELLTYDDLKTAALNGSLVGTVAGETGYVRMPFGSIPLPACHVEKIRAWVERGALEN